MKKIIALFMMGLITILSPLTLKANTYSIDQPVIDLNNHTLNEVFTATEKDLTDYEITSILDTPVYEGQSLRDIFEDGNLISNPQFENGATGWLLSNATGSVSNDIYNFTANAQYGRLHQTISLTNGNLIYYASSFKSSSNMVYLISAKNTPATAIRHSGSGNFELISNTYIVDNYTSVQISDFRTSDWTQIEVDYVYTLDITDLFTTAPMKNQLDEWLDIYLTLTSANSKTGTALVQDRFYVDYDNAKAYDYNIIAPYVTETPADIQAFMEDVLDKTITLAGIPDKMWIEKDRVVILGSYVVVGE